MEGGPSPLVPFLVVSVLVFFRHGRSLLNSSKFLALESLETVLTFVFIVSILALLLVHRTSQSIIIPLTFLVILYSITKVFLGPLILIATIYLANILSSSNALPPSYRGQSDGEGLEACGYLLLLVVVFFMLSSMLPADEDGDGSKWGIALLVMLFYLLNNLCYY